MDNGVIIKERVRILDSNKNDIGVILHRVLQQDGTYSYSTVIRRSKFNNLGNGVALPDCDLSTGASVYEHGSINPYLTAEMLSGTPKRMLDLGYVMPYDSWVYMMKSGEPLYDGLFAECINVDSYMCDRYTTEVRDLRSRSLLHYKDAMNTVRDKQDVDTAVGSLLTALEFVCLSYLLNRGTYFERKNDLLSLYDECCEAGFHDFCIDSCDEDLIMNHKSTQGDMEGFYRLVALYISLYNAIELVTL